jgi:hypothetical protein
MKETTEIKVTSRMIASFKRKWKDRFKEVTYSREMTDEENALFKNDPTLIRLIQKVERANDAVIEHMDNKIELYHKNKEAKE